MKKKYKSKGISELPWDLYSSSHLQCACLKCLWQGGRYLSILTASDRPWLMVSALFFILCCVFSYIGTWPCLCFLGHVLPDSLLECKYPFCLQMMCLFIWKMKKTINALFGQLGDCENKSVIHFELLKDIVVWVISQWQVALVFFPVVTLIWEIVRLKILLPKVL